MASVHDRQGSAVAMVFHYKIDFMNSLGHGGFGTVYIGHNKENSTTAAIKKVSLAHKRNQEKIISEATKVLVLLDECDENVVKVHEIKSYKNSMWIIMEYCDLGNLNNFFSSKRQMIQDIQCKVTVMVQIAKGLAFLHGKNIVHRDIKPANILVRSTEYNSGVVKLGDFGLSTVLDHDGLTATMSSDVGTLAFKAPEFWLRTHAETRIHRNIDVYAAGLTFLAMLQAKPEKNLVPKAEGSLEASEMRMPIGLAAFSRIVRSNPKLEQFILDDKYHECVFDIAVVDESKDDPTTQRVKGIIQEMTEVNPEDRLPASEVETKFRKLLGANNHVLTLV